MLALAAPLRGALVARRVPGRRGRRRARSRRGDARHRAAARASTSGGSRWSRCRRTCSRRPPSRRSCGWGCSRRRSGRSRRRWRAPVNALAAVPARLPRVARPRGGERARGRRGPAARLAGARSRRPTAALVGRRASCVGAPAAARGARRRAALGARRRRRWRVVAVAVVAGRPRRRPGAPPTRRAARRVLPRRGPGRRHAGPARRAPRCSSTPGRRTARSSRGCAPPASARSTCSSSPTRRPTTRAARAPCCRTTRFGLLLDGGDGAATPAHRAPRRGRGAARRAASWRRTPASASAPGRSSSTSCGRTPSRPSATPARTPTGARSSRGSSTGSFERSCPADAESDVFGSLDLEPVTALKVAHHGSADPGLPRLLARLRPRVAAIEVGRHNPYGHPTAPGARRAARRAARLPDRPRRHGARHVDATGRMTVATRAAKLDGVPSFKPAYLIHGDDHGRIARAPRAPARGGRARERRRRACEVLEGDAATPEAAAAALAAMTLDAGPALHDRRRRRALEGRRARARRAGPAPRAPPDTTVAFFAREDSRARRPPGWPPPSTKAGGDVAAERNVKPWELPKWVAARARELGLELDARRRRRAGGAGRRPPAAPAARAGEAARSSSGPGARLGADAVERLTARLGRAPGVDARRRAGRRATPPAALRTYLGLRAQGERLHEPASTR